MNIIKKGTQYSCELGEISNVKESIMFYRMIYHTCKSDMNNLSKWQKIQNYIDIMILGIIKFIFK